MSTDHVSTFETSLQGTATAYATNALDFAATLAEAIERPAVGTALPFEGVSLADTDVELDPSPSDVRAATTGVTPAALGIADYGTVTLPSRPAADEVVSCYCERHVAVVAGSDVVADMPAAYEQLDESLGEPPGPGEDTQVLATGPSATADMGSLVEGVHGPHECAVVVLEDR
jgi:L-lactate dehydrogenase complex protein LldG